MKTETEVKKPMVKAGSVWQMTTGSLLWLLVAERDSNESVFGPELCYSAKDFKFKGANAMSALGCPLEEATELVPASRVEKLLSVLKPFVEHFVTDRRPQAVHPSKKFCTLCGLNSAERLHDPACPVNLAEIAIRNEEGQ